MRLLALLLACALVACASEPPPSPVVTAPVECRLPWEMVRASAPPSIRLIEVQPVGSFVAAFNSMPPESDVAADQAFIAHVGDLARIFFVTAGCLTWRASISWNDALQMMGVQS